MDFQVGVLTRLLTAPAVSGFVGSRINWVTRPQKEALPAVSLQVISDPRPEHLKGFDGARETRVQCDCWAASYSGALGLARACIAALREPATVQDKKFGHARVEGQRDLGETVADGTFVHRQAVDLIIWHVGD